MEIKNNNIQPKKTIFNGNSFELLYSNPNLEIIKGNLCICFSAVCLYLPEILSVAYRKIVQHTVLGVEEFSFIIKRPVPAPRSFKA